MSNQPAKFADNDYCFACGKLNPLGLHLTFQTAGEEFATEVNPSPHWQGFQGIMHGGLQATIMDDLMSNFMFRVHKVWVTTGELSLRYRKPVPLDKTLRFSCRLKEHKGRVWTITAKCQLADTAGPVFTTGTGRFVEVPHPANSQ